MDSKHREINTDLSRQPTPDARVAVFLDRDGTLIEDVEYLSSPDQVRLLNSSGEAVALLNAQGILAVVVTNQSGVAKGYFDEASVAAAHERLDELLAEHGAHIDRYYYCPHHPEGAIDAYRMACECRKPRAGMLRKAARELGIDLSRSFIVGDKLSDLEAGAETGCRLILVRTGYGAASERDLSASTIAPLCVADDLRGAVDAVLREIK